MFPNGPPWRETSVSRTFFYTFHSKSPVKKPPIHVPQQGSYGERSFIFRANGLFIHSFIYICQSSQYGALPQKNGDHIWSPSTWTEGLRHIINGHCNFIYPPNKGRVSSVPSFSNLYKNDHGINRGKNANLSDTALILFRGHRIHI